MCPKTGRINKLSFKIILLTFVGLLAVLTLQLSHVARVVPEKVVVATLLLMALVILSERFPAVRARLESGLFLKVRPGLNGAQGPVSQAVGTVANPMGTLWVLAVPILLFLAGFVVGLSVFTFLYLVFRGKESWLFSALLTAGIGVGIYAFLLVLPGVSFDSGWLGTFPRG